MDFVKLDTSFYRDGAIQRAGEAAEVLFTRAMAYCGEQENGGRVEAHALPYLTPTRGRARAAALVREGLWEVIPDGWRFRSWDKHQVSKEQLEARRSAGRDRQARHRVRNATSDGVRNGVTNEEVTGTEVEEEVESQSPSRVRAVARGVDELTDDELRRIQQRLRCSEAHAARVVLEVMGRAGVAVLSPYRYVIGAIDREPDRYRPTHTPNRIEDQCTEHPGSLASNCGGCRSEQIAGDA